MWDKSISLDTQWGILSVIADSVRCRIARDGEDNFAASGVVGDGLQELPGAVV
jgi:hypothetical protein